MSALALKASSPVYCVKDGSHRKGDSNLTLLLLLGAPAAAAWDVPLYLDHATLV